MTTEQHNERRRGDSDLLAAINKVGDDCNEQHVETQQQNTEIRATLSEAQKQNAKIQETLVEMNRAHTVFHTKLSAVEETLGRVGTKVDLATERAAATTAVVDSLRGQNKDQYERLTEIEGNVKVLSGKIPEASKSVESQSSQGGSMSEGTIKILVGASVFALVCILIAFGAMTASEAKELMP